MHLERALKSAPNISKWFRRCLVNRLALRTSHFDWYGSTALNNQTIWSSSSMHHESRTISCKTTSWRIPLLKLKTSKVWIPNLGFLRKRMHSVHWCFRLKPSWPLLRCWGVKFSNENFKFSNDIIELHHHEQYSSTSCQVALGEHLDHKSDYQC